MNKINKVIINANYFLQFYRPSAEAVSISKVLHLSSFAVIALFFSMDANAAASLLTTARSIFTTIYAVVGVFGAIGLLVTGLNWGFGNFMGREDPKKLFFNVLMGVGLALGSVAIIQTLKTWVAGGGDSINSL